MKMKEALRCFTKNYNNFSGRASRKEFFIYHLILWSCFFLGYFLTHSVAIRVFHSYVISRFSSLVFAFLLLGSILPTLAVTVRRIHDIGRNGWWILLTIIPYLGLIFTFILFVKKGQGEDNRYGQSLLERVVIS